MNLFQTDVSIAELNTQLIDFGLYPQDWILSKQTKTKIKIQHKQEKTFYFLGHVEKQQGKAYWKTIHLAGL